MNAKQEKALYWACTGIVCAGMAFSGTMHLLAGEQVKQVITQLGYPMYFSTMLGIAKLLGVAVLLANRPARLKEWAYAGFAFDFIAATVSLVATGAAISETVAPVIAFSLLLGSYFTWHRTDRKATARDTHHTHRRAA